MMQPLDVHIRFPFNRTSMELKQGRLKYERSDPKSFNRTSMELKLSIISSIGVFRHSFNRTSMELKRASDTYTYEHCQLLIEPVWN